MPRSTRVVRMVIVGLALVATLLFVLRGRRAAARTTATPRSLRRARTRRRPRRAPASTTSTTTSDDDHDRAALRRMGRPGSRAGEPYGDTVEGLLTFRGQPDPHVLRRRSPCRSNPEIRWQFPEQSDVLELLRRRARSSTGAGRAGPASRRCSNATAETWVALGAYSRNVHFLDYFSGERLLPDFPTGDIIKGSVTIDPDGFPLLYTGSRDNFFRVIAFDGTEPRELWALNAFDVSPTRWNNDWDGVGSGPRRLLVHRWREQPVPHRRSSTAAYDADGMVTVEPELVFNTPGWDDELHRRGRRQRLDREFGRDLRQHRLLRQQRWPDPGMGHHRPRRRGRTGSGVSLLGGRRHRRIPRHRRRRDDLRGCRVRAGQRPKPGGRSDHQARSQPATRGGARVGGRSTAPARGGADRRSAAGSHRNSTITGVLTVGFGANPPAACSTNRRFGKAPEFGLGKENDA